MNNIRIDKNAFVCSYIGTIGMAHGLDVVLRAAQKDASIVFLIVGDGAYKEVLEQEAINSKLTNIHFTGLLPKHEIPHIIAESGAALIHLKKNPLFTTVIPSKMFELMSMDIPIIMGVEGEARNMVVEAHAGEIMEPENELDLLNAINIIRKNGRNYYHGRDYVAKEFDRNKLAQNMLDIIIAVANRKIMCSIRNKPGGA
jgi:glycosyltransferase involved in cell wall biosynthesis